MSNYIKQIEKQYNCEIIRCSNNKDSFLAYWSLEPEKILTTSYNQPIFPINIKSCIGGFKDLRYKYYIKTYF